MANTRRMLVAIALLVAAAIGLAVPAAQAGIGAQGSGLQVTQGIQGTPPPVTTPPGSGEGIGWD
jgi:hypothetical protein